MYFIMDCDLLTNEDGAPLMEIHNAFRAGNVRSWRGGRMIDLERANLPSPIEIDFEPLRGYQGPPIELLDVGIPIMSDRLATALQQAGVDNVAFFRALLTNTATGERFTYQAFNVVGVVAAADLGQSEWSSDDGKPVADVSFESLALDESKAGGLKMFRLAENINALLVRESVKDHILKSGINTLKFVPPDEWMHL